MHKNVEKNIKERRSKRRSLRRQKKKNDVKIVCFVLQKDVNYHSRVWSTNLEENEWKVTKDRLRRRRVP